ncbi:MAG: DUF882 domain-containing protein [Polyangiaceae bacterium]
MPAFVSAGTVLVLALVGGNARADVTHVVGRGHTLQAIANRYHVTVKAIADANHLTPADIKRLKVGDELKIPGVQPKAPAKSDAKAKKADTDKLALEGKPRDKSDATSKDKGEAHDKKAKTAPGLSKDGKSAKDKKPVNYAMRPKQPGVVHAVRLATNEEFTVKIADKKSKVGIGAQRSFEKMMRSTGNLSHPIEPRLIALVNVVSNHFGGRKIEVISGFRPYSPTQHTKHSNHNVGHAIDFRVVGVPNEVVRDFCRTLKNVGVGYYPNSTFVHMDAREASTFWIDYSKPGETPRYNSPNVAADEGTSDVAEAPPPGKDATDAPSDDAPKADTTDDSSSDVPAKPVAAPGDPPEAP